MHSSKRLLHAPASGYRNYPTGALTQVGTSGHCWSSSPIGSAATASFMEFYPANVRPEQSWYRATGFTVRCVQHLQAAFLKERFIFAPAKQLRPGVAGSHQGLPPVRSADSAIRLWHTDAMPCRLYIPVCSGVGGLNKIEF